MNDDLRRRDDLMSANLTTELALLKQGHELTERAAEGRWRATDKSIEMLTSEVRTTNALVVAGQTEPETTPMGRTLLKDIADLRSDHDDTRRIVDGHEALRLELVGIARVAKLAIAVSLSSAGAQLIGLLASLLGKH